MIHDGKVSHPVGSSAKTPSHLIPDAPAWFAALDLLANPFVRQIYPHSQLDPLHDRCALLNQPVVLEHEHAASFGLDIEPALAVKRERRSRHRPALTLILGSQLPSR